MTSASAAKSYFSSTDYYATCPGDWLGKGAEMLGLVGSDNAMHFHSLADNLDPRTGTVLRPHAKVGDRVGIDLTFNATKSVSIARELAGTDGDTRIEDAHREAVAYTMGLIEAEMQARVRVGKADHDRVTGNMVAYRVTHRDTRINADDQMPDMSLHDHVFVFNATFDPVEDKWKACQLGQIKHDAPYFEAIYHNRLATNLHELGYGIRRDGKAFEVAGISRELIEKFSRRNQYIRKVAAKLGITNPESKAKLGATTRLGKTKEIADDLTGYYVSRLTNAERQQLTGLQGLSSYECPTEKAVRYAIDHLFERSSVVEERKLYETAIRHGIGCVTPEGVIEEAKRQGVLLKDGLATTKGVLAEEAKIIAFASDGRGTMRPLSKENSRAPEEARLQGRREEFDTATLSLAPQVVSASTQLADVRKKIVLSLEQQALVDYVLTSQDRVILCIGNAGTGKTTSVRSAFEAIHCPVEMLAPSASASRDTLRKEGFERADTIASFLGSSDRQQAVKGGVIWVDEAGLLAVRDLSRLVDIAKEQKARIVLMGDNKQHASVSRDGNMLHVLQEFAGLPVGRLTQVRRQQRNEYKGIVADIAEGKQAGAFDKLDELGWVHRVNDNHDIVEAYLDAIGSKKAGQLDSDRVMVVAPTHAQGDEVTSAIRAKLKEKGVLGDEQVFETLRPLAWTEAEKADPLRYDGTEVLQIVRNSGPYRAGQRVRVADLGLGQALPDPRHFCVYRPERIGLAVGDRVRITANGRDKTGTHRLDNGSQYTVAAISDQREVSLSNGWVLKPDFSHITHGYVSTSHASQGKTVDRVLIAMGAESVPAISAEQFYVSVSRGRESAKVFTSLPFEELKQAIRKTDKRVSATEVFKPRKKRTLIDRVKRAYAIMKEAMGKTINKQREKEYAYER